MVAAETDKALSSLLSNDGLACESLSPASDPGETFDLTSVSCCRAGAEGKLSQPTKGCYESWSFKSQGSSLSPSGSGQDDLNCQSSNNKWFGIERGKAGQLVKQSDTNVFLSVGHEIKVITVAK